jgi:hypothetical protein
LIRAVISDGHAKNDFVIEPKDGTIDIGYDMCGGAFELEEGRHYRVSLSVIDAAGNETRAPEQPPGLAAP